MTTHLTPKENFLRVAKGEMPEYVPVAPFGGPGQEPLMAMADPCILGSFRGPGGGVDPWGVTFITGEDIDFAALPKPNDFILTDVTKWRDVIKAPDYSGFDWEAAARSDRAKYVQNPDKTAFVVAGYADLFQQFIGFMGFTEGLCAIYEEQEEVEELLDYMLEHSLYITKNMVHYYKPEGYYILDDTASKLQPFISPTLFEELFVPRYKQCLDIAREANIPIFYHNCGRCEELIPSMVDIGVSVWDPAQPENDLVSVKNKFGRKLAINGGFEYRMPVNWPNVDEEEVRDQVRKSFEDLSTDGGFIFSGMVTSLDYMDPDVQKVNGWILDEANKLSKIVYK
ncbi:uroporphyrinogen decarboxylase family protein [Alkalibacter mobilis]|uniref:uroporphyrinogen decarboxylase family protein n=1 Tax=Alkalibacter mobilis TaxID=2787712 RepID=UPI00189E4469|nr:uroporphyrinogen decarboxylase family protein [Alkalibacter mobilis]MBF7097420.1 veratrol--corrinoid protein metyltransferase [Alkalibacter mobilis]